MIKLIGQEKITCEFDTFELESLPRAILLVGLKGSGRSTLINNLGERLGIDIVELEKINNDILNNIYIEVNPKIYKIDLNSISRSEESELLKIIEEPPSGQYFILLATDDNVAIDPIFSRCMVYRLESYDEEILKKFISGNNTLPLIIGKTPGDILKLNNIDIKNISDYCQKLLTEKLDLYKTVEITNDLSSYDLNIFLRLMLNQCFKDSGLIEVNKLVNYVRLTAKYISLSLNNSFNKDNLLSSYILNLIEVNNNEY